MAKTGSVISFFNNKGGVSKTTTCFNLGWKLSKMGYKVVLVDTDPQCNLTGLALEVDEDGLIPESYQKFEKVNLYQSLLPALKSTGTKIAVPDLQKVANNENLLLLPGNVKLAEVETQLATALNMGSMLPAMQNVPGSFGELYRLILKEYNADFILIDMSPSLGALNQVNLLNADYFIVPMIPDIFSVMAIDSLSEAIPSWISWSERVKQIGLFDDKDLLYTFNPKRPKFLGNVIQRYRPRNGMPANSFKKYFAMLDEVVEDQFIPAMETCDLMISSSVQSDAGATYRLAEIADFNSLIASSQSNHKPVFELTEEDLDTTGAANNTQMEKVKEFNTVFEEFAKRVIELTG